MKDPILFYGDINLYRYVENNPVNWVDPWGLRPCQDINDCLQGCMDIYNSCWQGAERVSSDCIEYWKRECAGDEGKWRLPSSCKNNM